MEHWILFSRHPRWNSYFLSSGLWRCNQCCVLTNGCDNCIFSGVSVNWWCADIKNVWDLALWTIDMYVLQHVYCIACFTFAVFLLPVNVVAHYIFILIIVNGILVIRIQTRINQLQFAYCLEVAVGDEWLD